ncbi:MAG: type II secretion system protein GspL [Sphingomonadales bacterium]|jgi:general secretion pathway protein L
MTLLVTLARAPRWQRITAGRVTASGDGWPTQDADTPLVLAVPGEDVALHWLDLPPLGPVQAAAAARAALADMLAEADAHVAVAPGSGLRPVAVVSPALLAGWLAQAAAAGMRADAILPDTLLLPAPAAGWSVWRDGERVVARSRAAAMAGEADLATAIIGTAPANPATPALPDPLPLNLLVGDFAPVARWQPQPGLFRHLAGLAAAVALLWIGGDVAALLRARAAERAADAETSALGGGGDAAMAAAALAAKARASGAGGGLGAVAAPLVQALAQQPGAGLASLDYSPASGIVAGVAGGGDAQALAAALSRAGLTARVGATRSGPDSSITDVTVQRP